MRAFIKAMLIFALAIFALFNYLFITFDHGISQPSMEDKDIVQVLNTLSNVDAVKYYKKTLVLKEDKENDEIYRVYISTKDAAYLLDATPDQIDMLDFLSVFDEDFQPKKVTPIPFFVEVVVGLIILILPFGRRRKKEK